LFTGGENKMVDYIIDSLKMMVIVPTIHDDSTYVKISFRIDIKGEVLECKVLESNGSKEFMAEAFKATKSTSYCWIPALSGGKPVDFTYKIVYFVKRIKEESGPSRIGFSCYTEFD
jgi:TonB family protein